ASASASAPSTTPSSTAATTSASLARRVSSCTSASTACASARATSCASPRTATLGMSPVTEERVQLVLEAATLDRAVDPALLRCVRLPPPAACARRLVGRDRARARRAADRLVAAVVERVVRDVALAHVVPDLLLRPLGERVELHDRAVVVIDLDLADVRARRPLVPAEAGDPRVERVQVLRQRQHLADLAAEEPVLDLAVEEIRPVLADHARDVLGVGGEDLELDARIAVAYLLDQLERLLGQPAGVDREHLHVRVELVRHVDQHRAVDLERRGDGDPRREPLERPFEQRLRLLALEFHRELARL